VRGREEGREGGREGGSVRKKETTKGGGHVYEEWCEGRREVGRWEIGRIEGNVGLKERRREGGREGGREGTYMPWSPVWNHPPSKPVRLASSLFT